MDRELGFGERAALRLHFVVCEGCRNFNRQMHFLRRAIRELPESGDGGSR
ncbi:MAG TPA: hypothetical protein VNE59_12270 [Burkholderiales bacterium]|nr:hypothetical protein [Burkholderiales bacterium]